MRGLAIGFGIIFLTAFGVGAAELSQASAHQSDVPAPVKHVKAASPSPSPAPSSSITPAPTPSPSPVQTLPTATTNGFVHMRAGTSTSSAIVANLQGGTVVQLPAPAIGLWQPVIYQGLTGYVYTPYLNY